MKIRSTKELVYNSRDAKTAIIQLEVISWNYNTVSEKYYVSVVDSYVTTTTGSTTNELGEEIPVEVENVIQLNY